MPISKVIGRTAERVFTLNNAPVDAISRFDLSFITSLVLPNSGEKHIADNMHSWTQMNFVRSWFALEIFSKLRIATNKVVIFTFSHCFFFLGR